MTKISTTKIKFICTIMVDCPGASQGKINRNILLMVKVHFQISQSVIDFGNCF